MGMNVPSGGSSSEPDVMVDINTTPLIDVMLVLLIMLIITIPIQMHSVKMDLPVGNPPPPAAPPESCRSTSTSTARRRGTALRCRIARHSRRS